MSARRRTRRSALGTLLGDVLEFAWWLAIPVIGVTLFIMSIGGDDPAPASPQTTEKRIVAHDVDIRIEPEGDLLVTEVIEADFGAVPRHGIVRDIRTRKPHDDDHDRVYPLEVLSVDGSASTPDQYTVSERSRSTQIKIGDPDRTVTGIHTYTLTYRVEGALGSFLGHDELYWDAFGNESPVSAKRATVRVTAPAGITRVACFTGRQGSRTPCPQVATEGSTASFSKDNLPPFQGLTVVVAFPAGVVPMPMPILDESVLPPWHPQSIARTVALTPFTVGATAGLAGLVVCGFGVLVWRRGRDRRYAGSEVDASFDGAAREVRVRPFEGRSVPVEFLPPVGLGPAQVGLLFDERADTRDVTATIIDLARRGYLRIEELPRKRFRRRKDWKLVKLQEAKGLREYERILVNALFRNRARVGEVKLSELKKRFAPDLVKVQNALYRDAVRKGWFPHRPDQTRARWARSGFCLMIAGVGLFVAGVLFTSVALLATPVILAGLLLRLGSRFMPRRTAKGTAMARRARGFQRFIEEADADRARFAEQKHLFTEYLPYAVVFGSAKQWARTFAPLDDVPTGDWYVTSGANWIGGPMPVMLALDDLKSATESILGSTPGSFVSTAFGGGGDGGFSGGGGGGGGTDIW